MKSKMNTFLYGCLLSIVTVTANAHDNEPMFNIVNLQAESERDIPNDQMIVILAAEHEGNNPANISRDVNKDMQWALDIIKTFENIESKTGNYQTWPVYSKQTISGWRSSQQVEIKSENITSVTELIGKLQERLQVKQMTFNPADNTRKLHENELIEEAMEAFKERVDIIGKHMDQKNHRIVNININTGGYQPPIMYERAAMKSLSSQNVEQPAVEAGSSRITVNISGSVQFF